MSTRFFDKFANAISHGAGQPATFACACVGIALWAVAGPVFGFSETWQLVVNTGTTIITFLMVFVVQHTQNRDSDAVQAKLDELILALSQADNQFIGVERLSAQELKQLRALITDQIEHPSELPANGKGIAGLNRVVDDRADAISPRPEA